MNENNVYEISRSVSKTGEFRLVSDATVNWARNLSDADKI